MEGQGDGQGPRKHSLTAGWRLGGLRKTVGAALAATSTLTAAALAACSTGCSPRSARGPDLKANRPFCNQACSPCMTTITHPTAFTA